MAKKILPFLTRRTKKMASLKTAAKIVSAMVLAPMPLTVQMIRLSTGLSEPSIRNALREFPQYFNKDGATYTLAIKTKDEPNTEELPDWYYIIDETLRTYTERTITTEDHTIKVILDREYLKDIL